MPEVGVAAVGKRMKLEAVERGVPVGVPAQPADVHAMHLARPALESVPAGMEVP